MAQSLYNKNVINEFRNLVVTGSMELLKNTSMSDKSNGDSLKFQMNGDEFKFIRERFGLSRRQLGINAEKIMGKPVSSKTIYNWESKDQLNYMQIHLLRNSMPPDMFEEARKEYENIKTN
jgi:DNA-binding transcriptional regulator YiaG